MKNNFGFLRYLCALSLIGYIPMQDAGTLVEDDPQQELATLHKKMIQGNLTQETEYKKKRKNSEQLISFNFTNEDLVDVINFLAAQKEVNVVLPMAANAITSKLTLRLEEKVTLEEAWDMLQTVLDIAGYSIVQKGQMYNIIKTNKDITREPLPLYVGVKPEELPNTDERIRYLYYLTNIRIEQEGTSEIAALLRELLPDISNYKLDPQTNGVLISDKANNIRGVMNILIALDQAEIQDKPEIIKLRYVSADMIATLFNDQILKTSPEQRLRLDPRKKNEPQYFSQSVRLIAEPRSNSLIVLGRPQSIERVRDFINKYIDVELGSGKSILHIFKLQYLDAEKFAPVLERIVTSRRGEGMEQSHEGGSKNGGTERFFEEVKIIADSPKTASGELPEGVTLGSNNLIIAARNDDWIRIKALIEQLDTPQPQVIIEVLIADLSIDDERALGAAIRNPALISPHNVNYQSAFIQPIILGPENTVDAATTLQADLLRKAFAADATPTSPTPGTDISAAKAFTPAGGTVFSLNDSDGKTWGVGQIVKTFNSSKVLSHPHVIATNNKQAEIIIKEERLIQDEASGTTGGTTTATRKWIPAELSVQITPRISADNTVNMHVVVTIEEFSTIDVANDANSGNRVTRNVTTNANIATGSILALGGLTRVDTDDSLAQTPILGEIPIVGWFFKKRAETIRKRNLTVFISPTIIQTRLRGGIGEYTKDHSNLAKQFSKDSRIFDNLKDPITRWFFRTGSVEAPEEIDNFTSQDEFMREKYDRRLEDNVVIQTVQADTPQKNTLMAQAKSTQPEKLKPVTQVVAQIDPTHNIIVDDREQRLRLMLENM